MKVFYNAAPEKGFWKQHHIRANALFADAEFEIKEMSF